MKLRILIFAAIVAIVAIAQSTQLIPVWDGQRYAFPRLGPTLKIANGQLDAVLPTVRRHVDVALSFNSTAGGWPLPAASPGLSISNLAVHVNGFRYHSGLDYSANGGIIKALADNMDPSSLVICDYDEQ